jgi:hypothetical protein
MWQEFPLNVSKEIEADIQKIGKADKQNQSHGQQYPSPKSKMSRF